MRELRCCRHPAALRWNRSQACRYRRYPASLGRPEEDFRKAFMHWVGLVFIMPWTRERKGPAVGWASLGGEKDRTRKELSRGNKENKGGKSTERFLGLENSASPALL